MRTTWKLRLGILIVLIVAVVLTKPFWVAQIGRSLVCARDVAPSDVILIENFDVNYLLFERAAALEQAGLGARTIVPVQIMSDPSAINPISQGIAELMARQARMRVWETVPIREVEPISLNVAVQVREYLRRERVKSLIVVTDGFRSRRTALVYRTVFGNVGMHVRCDPVFGLTSPERWTESWHGIQDVAEQFLKLQYYRFYVIPFSSPRGGGGE